MALVLNGDGNVTGLTAGGLPDASITQSDLAAGVAGNGPTFYAYRSTVQSLPAGSQTTVQFDTKKWDSNGCYNNTGSTASLNGISCPAWSFAPNVAGYYLVVGTVRHDVSNSFVHTYLNHSSDGTVGTGSFFNVSGIAQAASNATTISYFNGTTHYMTLGAYVSGTGNCLTGQGVTYFTACLIRAA